MDDDTELIERHGERISGLFRVYWGCVVVGALVIGGLAWILVPTGPLAGVIVVIGLVLLAAWLVGRSEAWLIAACGGSPADEADQPRLAGIVESLCFTSGVAPPDLRVVASSARNLVAVGRVPERSVLIVTTGLLDSVDRIELEALVASEIAQIRSLDIAHVTAAATTVGLPALLADLAGRKRRGAPGPLSLLGSWCAVGLLPLAGLSRRRLRRELEPDRDFRTDLAGVRLTRYPPGMIAALERLDGNGDGLDVAAATSVLWVVDPGHAEIRPSVTTRIAALREL